MTGGFTVEYTPARGSRQRVRYEPQTNSAGYWRIAEVWSGCRWRIQGREPVRDVSCDHDMELRR